MKIYVQCHVREHEVPTAPQTAIRRRPKKELSIFFSALLEIIVHSLLYVGRGKRKPNGTGLGSSFGQKTTFNSQYHEKELYQQR